MTVDNWAIQLQNAQPGAIAASPFDLVVVDRDFWDGSQTRPYSPNEVIQMEQAANGEDRSIFAYMSVGLAASYRDYWDASWTTAPPSWLGESMPNWPGSYAVQFWDEGWQNVLYGNPDAYLDRIIGAGFRGVFLDNVDLYHSFDELAFDDGSSSANHMVDLVAELSAYAKQLDPEFQIYVNGAEDLLADARFLGSIDGINKESLYYGVNGLGVPNTSEMIAYSTDLLDGALAAGKTFSI